MFLIVCLSYVLHIHSMAIDMHVATMQNSPPLAASPKLLDLVFFDGGNGWSAYHGGMLHIVPLTISDVYIYIYICPSSMLLLPLVLGSLNTGIMTRQTLLFDASLNDLKGFHVVTCEVHRVTGWICRFVILNTGETSLFTLA